MMSIKKVCDICGKEISPHPAVIKYGVTIKKIGFMTEELDVCRECIQKIIEQIRSEGSK